MVACERHSVDHEGEKGEKRGGINGLFSYMRAARGDVDGTVNRARAGRKIERFGWNGLEITRMAG